MCGLYGSVVIGAERLVWLGALMHRQATLCGCMKKWTKAFMVSESLVDHASCAPVL